MVYLASFWLRPLHDQDHLDLPWDRIVTVLPSGANSTGLSRRKAASSAFFLLPILRQTSTTTSLVPLVLTSTDPKSTSTTTAPPGWAEKRWLSFSSVTAQAATALSRNRVRARWLGY